MCDCFLILMHTDSVPFKAMNWICYHYCHYCSLEQNHCSQLFYQISSIQHYLSLVQWESNCHFQNIIFKYNFTINTTSFVTKMYWNTWDVIIEKSAWFQRMARWLGVIKFKFKFKFKNILFGINTKSHTLTNGESETQQGFIWLNAHNYIVR